MTRHWIRRYESQPAHADQLGADEPLGDTMAPTCPILHPIPMNASAFVPKAGAQCVSSARWDLCGGPPARAVPTAITPRRDVAGGRVDGCRRERETPKQRTLRGVEVPDTPRGRTAS